MTPDATIPSPQDARRLLRTGDNTWPHAARSPPGAGVPPNLGGVKLPFGLGKNSSDSEPGRVDPSADPTQTAGQESATTRIPAADGRTAQAQPPNPGERAAPQAVGAPKSKSRWPLGKDADKSAAGGAATTGAAEKAAASTDAAADRSAPADSSREQSPKPATTPVAEKSVSLDGSTEKQTADTETAAIPVREMPKAPKAETASKTQVSPDSETQAFPTQSSSKSEAASEDKGSGSGAGKAAATGAAGAGIGALVGAKASGSDSDANADARTQAFSQPQDPAGRADTAAGEGRNSMAADNSNNQTTAFPTAGYNYADFDENTQAYDYDGTDGTVEPTTIAEPAAKPVRGTADFGLFILRVVVAALLGLHSLRIVFGLFGGPGFDGMEEVFSTAGFDQAQLLAQGFGIIELVAAVILLLGIVTPVGATILLALVGLSAALTLSTAGGTTILGGSDLSGAPGGGLELHILYAAALLTVLFAGGGRWGLDAGRKWAAAPKWSGFLGIIVAVAAVVAVWYALNGGNPLSS